LKIYHAVNQVPENSDLIIGIRQGNSQSFELLYRVLYPRLCVYARKFLQNTDDAEEVVQELFYNLWKNRDNLDENKSLYSYLFTSVKNSCLNLIQSKKCRTTHAELMRLLYVEGSADNNNSYHTLLALDLEKDFQSALEKLPQECRKIFVLSRIEGLKYQEITARLNVSIKTVETQMSRALSKLRLQLKEHMSILLLLSFLN
jgi:RNA polymerase sigma-70 factor (ECF subfamily)